MFYLFFFTLTIFFSTFYMISYSYIGSTYILFLTNISSNGFINTEADNIRGGLTGLSEESVSILYMFKRL